MEQLGKYGFLRRDYLKNHRNSLYQVMLLQDTIGEHLLEVDKAAREREEVILKQLEEKEPLPDKEKDQMAWVRAANQHRAIEDGSTLVPMRFLFEQMGADVEWNQETQTATATLDNTAVTFAIDDTNAEVNNTPATMDVPARLINGKTMVPLRFLSEEMGFEVTWDAESRTAIIE